jgi:DNA-binding winged helix-turn-helix (wHTH) protein/TolB-like protein/tetratricopeptide (TPR) repeat protein
MNTVDFAAMRAKAGMREYKIGRFTLQPYRELLGPDGPVPVKPKALAILSVLAEADGALVTKDELVAAVWPNVIVEDNAIQAHVASLRKTLGDDAELLCTVHGHGYRLIPTLLVPSKSPGVTQPVRPWRTPYYLLAILLAVGAATGSLWLFRDGTHSRPVNEPNRIAILPFDLSESGPQMAGLANELHDKIVASLSGAGILVTSGGNGERPVTEGSQAEKRSGAEFQVSSRISSSRNRLRVQMQISDTAEDVSVWSGTFEKDISDLATLPDAVATAVADAAHFALIGRTGKVRLNAAGVAALVEARESMTAVNRPNPLLQMADYKRILATTPNFSWAHSGLAAADAFQLKSDPRNEALQDEARREAMRALELEPANGEAYLALELILPRFSWEERELVLQKGIKADPGFAPGSYMEGRLLSSVGRNRDAIFWFRRGHNMDPLHANNTFTYAVTLMLLGSREESEKLLDQMDAQWPQHIATRNAHFWASLLSGAQDKTLAILDDASRWPVGMNQKAAEAWRWGITATPENRTQARVTIMKAATEGSLSRGHALLLLSMLHDVDGAFEEANQYLPSDPQWGPLLFLEPTRPMRSDPRFMRLAVKLGFAAYWRTTGQWPDFCSETSLPYDCMNEVKKLAAQNPSLKPMEEVQKASIPY